MIKLDVISGFLGSGKTSFIKKLIEHDAFPTKSRHPRERIRRSQYGFQVSLRMQHTGLRNNKRLYLLFLERGFHRNA